MELKAMCIVRLILGAGLQFLRYTFVPYAPVRSLRSAMSHLIDGNTSFLRIKFSFFCVRRAHLRIPLLVVLHLELSHLRFCKLLKTWLFTQ